MKKYILLLAAAIVATAIFGEASAQSRSAKQTFDFAIRNADTLRLDFYPAVGAAAKQPVVVFVFGGGFVSGTRDSKQYAQYFDFLNRKGWAVASIDYRLGLKTIAEGKEEVTAKGVLRSFIKSVDMAVEDLYGATCFLIDNADKLSVDTKRIVASGSSAGAITCMQGEWNICRGDSMADVLPEGFNYAGVVSFAGAVLSTNGRPEWKSAPCPVMMFHGSSDSNVPYDKVRILRLGFFGSKYLCEQFDKMNTPYWFYDVEYEDHSLATTPMHDKLEEVELFLNEFVDGGMRAEINTEVKLLDHPKGKTRFGIGDYVRSNFNQ